MKYQKLSKSLDQTAPTNLEPWLSDIAVEKLNSAAGIALAIIAAAGIVSLTVVAPNVLMLLDKLVFSKRGKGVRLNRKTKINKTVQTFYYLKKHGLIKFKGDDKLSLTEQGKKRLLRYQFSQLSIKRLKTWDGKWWQVAADIPTKQYRIGADLLRKKLKTMGFFPLQRTLWFYPFDPRREVEFICQQYGIGQFVTIMEISRMDVDDEAKLKEFFTKVWHLL